MSTFGNEQDEFTNVYFELYDSFTGQEQRSEKVLEAGGLPWPVLLQEYIKFLEKYYGFEILQEVAIRRNPVRVCSDWEGQFFGIASDQEIELHRLMEEWDAQDALKYGGTTDE